MRNWPGRLSDETVISRARMLNVTLRNVRYHNIISKDTKNHCILLLHVSCRARTVFILRDFCNILLKSSLWSMATEMSVNMSEGRAENNTPIIAVWTKASVRNWVKLKHLRNGTSRIEYPETLNISCQRDFWILYCTFEHLFHRTSRDAGVATLVISGFQ